jgi:hypothetical protein
MQEMVVRQSGLENRSPERRNWSPFHRGPDEEGFALLEVLIAFSVFFAVIMATSTGAIAAAQTASAAQQRSVASTLISADVANVTDLPFSDLTAGLNPTAESLSNDPNIQASGSTYVLKLTGATLATANAKSSDSPLVPHISTTTIGIPYRVATYPQVISNGIVTLVVIVSWTSALGGTAKLVGETEIAAP